MIILIIVESFLGSTELPEDGRALVGSITSVDRNSSSGSEETKQKKQTMIIAGCGVCCLDMYSTMRQFPQPDTKSRADSSFHVEVGGNAANVMIALSSLLAMDKFEEADSLSEEIKAPSCRFLSKIGSDVFGQHVLSVLNHETSRIDSQFVVVAEGSTAVSHIIVSGENCQQRTIIHCPTSTSELTLTSSCAEQFLSGVTFLFLDGRHLTAARELMRHCQLTDLNVRDERVSIMLELERIKPSEPELLDLIEYVQCIVCSESFVEEYIAHERLLDLSAETKIVDVMIHLFRRMKHMVNNSFVNVSIGSRGSLLLTRRQDFLEESQLHQFQNTSVRNIIQKMVSESVVVDNERPIVSYSRLEDSFILIHCDAFKQLSVRDTTCAGDSFHAGLILSLTSSTFNEGSALQESSILAGCVCSEIGLEKGLQKYCSFRREL